MKRIIAGLLGATILTSPAYALKVPRSCGHDTRIRCAEYDPGQIWEIWTAPGGTLVIQFPEDESVPEGNVGATDGSRLKREPRGNFLFLKSTAKEGQTPCMVPEPLLVTTKLPNGGLRPYIFQIETHPSDCSQTPAAQAVMPHFPIDGVTLTSAAAPAPKPVGNLRYIAADGLAAGADVMYSIQFSDPRAEAMKRHAASEAHQAAAERRQAQEILKRAAAAPYGNKFDGSWNFRYVAHGSMTGPAEVRDNGYQTVFLFPQMQRVPSLYRMQPGATRCNREPSDRNEATENPSVHRGGADGDTIVARGTAPGWCLRDGNTVLEVLNLGFSVTGSTPATGTLSPYVKRTLKGEEPEPEPEPVSVPVPLQQPQTSQSPQMHPAAVLKTQRGTSDEH